MSDTKRIYQNAFYAITLHCFQDMIVENTVRKGFRKMKVKMNRDNVATFTANLHGEVSEWWDAFRAGTLNKPCEKAEKMKELGLPPLTCSEEELADIFIRLLDTAHAAGVNLPRAAAAKHAYNTTRPRKHGGKKA